MKSIFTTLLAVLIFATFGAHAEDAPASEPVETAEQSEEAGATNNDEEKPESTADETMRARPGGLRETVSETLRTFTPSEEIDVDRPVDFPTNI